MKSKLLLKVVMVLISFWLFVPGAAGQADERLMEVLQLSQQGKPKEAFVAGQKYLKDLRKSLPEADHPAIGFAAIAVGMAASDAGEHEEAVRLLREGLPIISRMREGQLLADELPMFEALVSSLEALEQTDEALAVLEDLLDRSRKQFALRANGGGLKIDQPGGPAVDLGAALVNEDSLAGILERIGMLKLGMEKWEAAEKNLKESEEILRRLHPDEQQARLVKIREGWEQAARKQGKAIRPHLVGRFSTPRTILIEGAGEISEEDIYSALTRSSAYVLASHPSAEFEEYLKNLKRCLELGYQANGFPKATVKVDWDETKDAVLARIVEGPRSKMGEIRVQGAKALTVEQLVEALVHDPDAEEKPISRAEEVYEKIAEQKGLTGDQVGKSIMEFFPENLTTPADGEADKMPSFSGLATKSDASTEGVWEADDWVDYQPSFLDRARATLHSAYATEGHFFPKFELKLVPEAESNSVDLFVEVIEEGPALRLGKIHVAGNRINTREELLAYLALEEGMELKGDYIGRVKRKLYESGRFLGWEVISRRAPKSPGKIDLLIEVSEEWEAPRLFQPLTREQEVMLKFAKWMNEEAGDESDVVFSASVESELGPIKLSLAMGSEAMALSADLLGHHFRMVADQEKEVDFVIRSDRGSSFRAVFPVESSPLAITFNVLKTHQADPFASTGSYGMGFMIGKEGSNLLRFHVDPAAALAACESRTNALTSFENGELILESEGGITMRIDGESGHLISMIGSENGNALEWKSEVGGVARLREETKEAAQGAENWAADKTPYALFYQAMGYAFELVQDEGFGETGTLTKLSLTAAADRSKRWEPLAVFLGDITGTIRAAVDSLTEKRNSAKIKNFSIPIDTEEYSAKLQAGSTMNLLLALGAYDLLAEFVEPGSWQDLVSREILFYMDGKPFYQKQSIETLLEDASMGPLGSLLCARLLRQAGNPAASRFIKKARLELNEEGFAKDWLPLLNRAANEDGLAWKIFESLQKLDDEKIDGFLPADPPEMRATAKELVAEARKVKPGADAETFRPIAGRLWEEVLNTTVEGMVDDMEESLSSKVDPTMVAATVNGFPAFRGAVRLMEKLEGGMLIRQAFPIPRMAWQLNNMQADDPESDRLEDWITTLLLAQQMWNKGQSARPEFVEQWAETIASDLGPDGWDQIAKLGLTREQYKWWVGTLIAAQVYGTELLKKEITDDEIRAYYEANENSEGAVEPEIHLYTIRLKLEGEGGKQKKLAESIRKKVAQAQTMEEMVKVFKQQATQHSNETNTKEGGYRGWVQLSNEFFTAVAEVIGKVPEQSLSEVIEITLEGQGYLYLALIPDKKRPGKAKPFEELKMMLRMPALLDRERKLLMHQADIQIIPEPERDSVTGTPKAPAKKGLWALLDAFDSKPASDSGEGEGKKKPKKNEDDKKPEVVIRKAGEGSTPDLYTLGSYIERGLVPEDGHGSCVDLYERAAEGGERRAMLRLAELYRTGRFTKQDDGKAQEWRERALACPSIQ